ncbi:fucosyltransferase-like protein [Leptotrombidium deliense]|uniref:Fucosyltransferase n=1 Tax=Leptotrombidium deliense TaxID=299467 RepID=A0A443SSE8_9ACAR|nr:fucosyltransferase-like protein [Leptotrombidium deliense]
MRRLNLKTVFLIVLVLCFAILISTHVYLSNNLSNDFKIAKLINNTKSISKRNTNKYSLFQWAKGGRPWFMSNGTLRPKIGNHLYSQLALYPEESDDDRIVNQLMFIPDDYDKIKESGIVKKILVTNGFKSWQARGRDVFLKDNCPVDTCSISTDFKDFSTADAVFFTSSSIVPRRKNITNQIWIYYLLESPLNSKNLGAINHVINLVATYRHDSDIVTPYEKFVQYNDDNIFKTRKNYAKGKTKKVAWFVSNCRSKNERLQFALQLKRHIEVDIFGRCGPLSCPRSKAKQCFHLINREYKFYLSFENSNCEEYITEKFFLNGLMNDVIPIVMGAKQIDYKRVAPYHSYIHASDFSSPKHLAKFLLLLDNNDTLYNSYFEWKQTGEFINTHFWCRVCALLHSNRNNKVYANLGQWWRRPGICGYATNTNSSSKPITYGYLLIH